MERRSHVLIDAAESNVADDAVFQGRDLSGGSRDWTVRLRRCRGGRSEGVQVVEIDNGYRPTGAIYIADGSPAADAALHRNQEEWRRWQLEQHSLDSAAVGDIEPALAITGKAVLLPGESQVRPPRQFRD